MAVVAPHPWTPPVFDLGEIVFARSRAGDAFVFIAEIIKVEEHGYRVHYMAWSRKHDHFIFKRDVNYQMYKVQFIDRLWRIRFSHISAFKVVRSGLKVGTQCFYPSRTHRPAIVERYTFEVGEKVLGKMRAEYGNSKLYVVEITWREEYDCAHRYHITYVDYDDSWDFYIEAHEVSRLLFRIIEINLNFTFVDSNGANHVLPIPVTTRLPLENNKVAVTRWLNTLGLGRRITKNRVSFVVRGQTLDTEISAHNLMMYANDQVTVMVA